MTAPRPTASGILGRLRKFARAREAAAAVEFALIMPVMLTLYLGSTELAQLINVDRRVTVIAGTVGDLVARAKNSIGATTLTDYFQAAQAIVSPFSTTSLTQVVTMVKVTSAGAATVEWSKAYNGGVAKTTGATYTLPSAMLDISKGNWVIVSEAGYSYRPLLGLFFKNSFPLFHQNFYLPRYAADITYDASS